MEPRIIKELYDRASERLRIKDFNGALHLTYEMIKHGEHPFVIYHASPLLIDIGAFLNNEVMIKQGISKLERQVEKLAENKAIAMAAYFNLANGYKELFHLKFSGNRFEAFFREIHLNRAVFYLWKALECPSNNAAYHAKVWTHLGVCYDHMGRLIEAMECYEKALKLDPKNGISLGNKGAIYYYFAGVMAEKRPFYLREAYAFMTSALTGELPPKLEEELTRKVDAIKRLFKDEAVLTSPAPHRPINFENKSEFETFYLKFCLSHKLYLNICNFCQKCENAEGDPIDLQVHRKMDERMIPYANGLNRIKQDFITARFMMAQSVFQGIDIEFVNSNVHLIDMGFGAKQDIRIQMMKTAYRNLYDILDSIGIILNDYLQIGLPLTRANFKSIWNLEDERIKEKIMAIENLNFYSFYMIQKELDEGRYRVLRKIRENLVQRNVNVYRPPSVFNSLNEEHMPVETFEKSLIGLARLVRNAIMYLFSFIHIEERKLNATTHAHGRSHIAIPQVKN